MTTHLVTFSDESMSRSRDLCIESALSRGKVDTYRRYSPWDIKGHVGILSELQDLYETHKALFDAPRGCGYWAWKPTILYYYVLQYPPIYGINEGDIVVYADAGVEFIDNVNYIIDRMDQDIFLFGNNWEHAHWCKRDIVSSVWPVSLVLNGHKPRYPYPVPDGAIAYSAEDGGLSWDHFGKQCQASVIFFRVSDYSKQFVAEWLKWCLFEGGRLIDDSPSRAPNHPEFRENRHDQAILTTLAYREGIKLHWWPSVYNRGSSPEFVYEKLPEYASDDYPVLFSHHRKRNHEWSNAA